MALTALDLGEVRVSDDDGDASPASLRRLVAVLLRFQALRSLRFEVYANTTSEIAPECVASLLAAASRLPALTELGVAYCGEDMVDAASGQLSILAELPVVRRLQALELREMTSAALLPPLLAPAVASTLTALRALSVDLGGNEAKALHTLWRASFVSQLTRLEFTGLFASANHVEALLAALPPTSPAPLLRSIREIAAVLENVCHEENEGLLSADGLRRLLAAANPATLEALALDDCQQGAVALLAGRAGAFTALRRLRLNGRDFWLSESDVEADGEDDVPAAQAWHAIQGAPFARLESLDVACAQWLLHTPERLGALLSAPWAASLVELSLRGSNQPLQAGAFAALSALPQLRRLLLANVGLEAAELEDAIASGVFAGLAARLTELTIDAPSADARVLVLLGIVPFERLDRLTYKASNDALLFLELQTLGYEGAAWLPRLSRLELCARRTRPYVVAAALDPNGPLCALHRGGGEVVWVDQ